MKLSVIITILFPLYTYCQTTKPILKVETGILLLSAYNCNYDYHGSSDVYPESCFSDLFFPIDNLNEGIFQALELVDTLKRGLKLGPIENRNYYKSISEIIACDSSFCYRFHQLYGLPVKITFRLYPAHEDMSVCGHTYFEILLKSGHHIHCTNIYQGFTVLKVQPLYKQ